MTDKDYGFENSTKNTKCLIMSLLSDVSDLQSCLIVYVLNDAHFLKWQQDFQRRTGIYLNISLVVTFYSWVREK